MPCFGSTRRNWFRYFPALTGRGYQRMFPAVHSGVAGRRQSVPGGRRRIVRRQVFGLEWDTGVQKKLVGL